jgi:hypothetical protein
MSSIHVSVVLVAQLAFRHERFTRAAGRLCQGRGIGEIVARRMSGDLGPGAMASVNVALAAMPGSFAVMRPLLTTSPRASRCTDEAGAQGSRSSSSAGLERGHPVRAHVALRTG